MDINSFFKTRAGFGAHAQSTGGTADVVPAEFGAFQEKVRRVRLDLTVEAAHDAGQAGGFFTVGDDQHFTGQSMGLSVQGRDALTVFGPPDDDLGAFDVPHVKSMHGLAGLQHDEVGDVDNVVDGAHPSASDAALHPVGGVLDP